MSIAVGKVLKDGHVLAGDLIIRLDDKSGGRSGKLALPRGYSLTAGEYDIVLDNGGRGRIVIDNATWIMLPSFSLVPFELVNHGDRPAPPGGPR